MKRKEAEMRTIAVSVNGCFPEVSATLELNLKGMFKLLAYNRS